MSPMSAELSLQKFFCDLAWSSRVEDDRGFGRGGEGDGA